MSDPQELIAELQLIAPHLATKLTMERLGFMQEIAKLRAERDKWWDGLCNLLDLAEDGLEHSPHMWRNKITQAMDAEEAKPAE